MIKVCLYSDRFFPIVGGTELQAFRAARKILEGGRVGFLVVTRRHEPSWPEVEEVDGLRIHRLPPAGLGKAAEFAFVLTSLVFLFRIRKDFKILHFLLVSFPNSLVALVMKLLGKRVLVKIAGAGVLSRGNPPARIIRNFILRRMDGFLATTDEIVREFQGAGFDPRRIHRIPNGVDTGHFAPVSGAEKKIRRRDLSLPEEGKIILYSGRISAEKGPHLLLEAWLRLAAEFPDLCLVIIGSGRLQEKNIETRMNQLLDAPAAQAFRARVIRKGEVSDLAPFLQAADLFALPSLQEGLSNALLEAMASGLPVLATRLPGTVEALGENGGGVLVNPGETGDLARGLREILAAPERWPEAGSRNRKRAEEYFSLAEVARRYSELYGSFQS
ncbi:MAG: glycosyltransferase family 4 protein [Proteobacteria bacterium]|nr:glycosyltransferase family 4 protein [Pseudomonadota bacterium]